MTGLDYFVLPVTKSIHLISDFNPELGGVSGFSIKSDRVFEVVIPYLIDTSENKKVCESVQKWGVNVVWRKKR